MTESQQLYKKHFGETSFRSVRAPGRLELLGNHTDYNEGLVMSLAVDRYIEVAFAPRNDGKVELVSTAFSKPEIFWADRLEKNPEAAWADYIKGVLEQLRKRGIHFSGFNAALHGTIPMGAGMSSSAALEVATALAVRQMFPYALKTTGLGAAPERDSRGNLPPLTHEERIEIAKLCRDAENQFVGVRCGLLDQLSSLCGRAGCAMEIDFQSTHVKVEPLAGEAIVVCNSGVHHSLVAGAYNQLRQNCENAAGIMGVRSLRMADEALVKKFQPKMTEREFECAWHVVTEIHRVAAGVRALREDDHVQFGQFMFQSHESSRDFFRNSVPELDKLVALAHEIPGCLGARLTGGGFGGATINLVAHHQAESFMQIIAERYEKATGIKTNPILCQIVDGAD
jgi:galactokinase